MSRLRLPNGGLRCAPHLSQLPLEEVDLQNNRLRTLDHLPPTLKTLNVSHNCFINDGIFFPFPRLEQLNMSDNRITIFEGDEFVACFPSLLTLDFSRNCLKDIYFLRSSTLQILNVRYNRLQTLAGLPQNLEELYADSCNITMIQSKLPPTLQILDLTYNRLRYAGLPLQWSTGLRELHLDRNEIERFPRKLPESLEVLTMSGNCLTELPMTLPESLTCFIASSNQIRLLPSYTNHKRFTLFLIDDNCLTEVPVTFPASVFDAGENWAENLHHLAQRSIKQCWKRYLLRLRLRHYKRVSDVKEELFSVSMMPERWEQVDVIDPVWFRRRPFRSHTDPHSD